MLAPLEMPAVAPSNDLFGAISSITTSSPSLLDLPDCLLDKIFTDPCGDYSLLDATARLTCSAARDTWDRSRGGALANLTIHDGEDHKIGTLARLLARLPDCVALSLEGALSPQLLPLLSPALKLRLRDVTLRHCTLLPLTVATLKDLAALRSLEVLSCSLASILALGRWIGSHHLSAPSPSLVPPLQLEQLCLRGCKMGAEAAWTLAECFRISATKMEGGDIPEGSLPSSALPLPSPSPSGGSRLRHLDLSHNCLGDEGARAVAQILTCLRGGASSSSSAAADSCCCLSPPPSSMMICHLDLGFNNITYEGARHLALALAPPSSSSLSGGAPPPFPAFASHSSATKALHHLSLAGNRLRLEGGGVLVQSLLLGPTYRGGGGEGSSLPHHLDLSWSDLGEEGVLTLAKTLLLGFSSTPAPNTTLRCLDLRGNCFGDKAREEAREAVRTIGSTACEILI